jgi:DNA-binding IclR family transcriptional regulator
MAAPKDDSTNRSLERGIEILRAFRPGVDALGNGELAERTGIPKATISRLTRTLVECGLLEPIPHERAYRLAGPVLSFAHAMRMGSPVLRVLAPLMRRESAKRRLNVGLAAPDRAMMVYLESVRYAARPSLRRIVAGQQVPVELTSLGRAFLASLSSTERQDFFACHSRASGRVLKEVEASIREVETHGYCAVSWQPGVLAVAAPLMVDRFPTYVINLSTQDIEQTPAIGNKLGTYLLDFVAECAEALREIG